MLPIMSFVGTAQNAGKGCAKVLQTLIVLSCILSGLVQLSVNDLRKLPKQILLYCETIRQEQAQKGNFA